MGGEKGERNSDGLRRKASKLWRSTKANPSEHACKPKLSESNSASPKP